MTWLIYHIVSGEAFFSGLLMLLLAGASIMFIRKGNAQVWALTIVGAGVIYLSATPLPNWLVLIWIVLGLCMIALWKSEHKNRLPRKFPITMAAIFMAFSLGVGVWELSWLINPKIDGTHKQLYVVGDSLSAGIGEEDYLWPDLLAKQHGLTVTNLARAGATAETAMDQAVKIPAGQSTVILEIGGNDLLGGTPDQQFDRDLEKLLKTICQPGRQVVMLELPLDFSHRNFGKTQRRLASQYGVKLIHKRMLATIFNKPNTTVDYLHLSKTGHDEMAKAIGQLMEK